MIAVLLTLTLAFAFGLIITSAVGGRMTVASLIGESILIGVGFGSMLLLLLSDAGVTWSRGAVLVSLAVVSSAVAASRWRTIGTSFRDLAALTRPQLSALPADLLTTMLLAGYAVFATLARLPEHDFLAIWGLKARTFFEHGGIDWRFLESRWNDFCHPDYPPLVPLSFDFVAILGGAWEDRWIGLLYAAFGLAAILVARSGLRDVRSGFTRSVATLAVAGLALTPWVGLGDGVVACYAVAALVLLRAGLRDDDGAALVRGALLLGFAAFAKNEGVATLVAYGAAFLFAARSRKRRVALLPALLVPLPWWIARAVHQIDSGILRGSLTDRVVSRVLDPAAVSSTLLSQHFVSAWLVAGFALAAIVCIRRRTFRDESFLLLAVGSQIAIYIVAYFVASYDLEWLVKWSWERVATQFLLPMAWLAAIVAAGDQAASGAGSGLRRMSKKSSAIPTQIAESATLNAGQ